MSTIPRKPRRRQAGQLPLRQGRYDFLGRYFHDLDQARGRAQAYADKIHASTEIFDRVERRWIYVYPAEYRCQRCNHRLSVPPQSIFCTVYRCEHCAPQAWNVAVREALAALTAAAPGSVQLLGFTVQMPDGTREEIDAGLVAAYLGAECVGSCRYRLWEADRV